MSNSMIKHETSFSISSSTSMANSNLSIQRSTSSLFRENPDQNRLITNSRPTTSTSTQNENSKIVPVLDIIENDNSEKSDFKDDGSYSRSISKITNPSTGQ